jgi:hypothetical protein
LTGHPGLVFMEISSNFTFGHGQIYRFIRLPGYTGLLFIHLQGLPVGIGKEYESLLG